MAADPITFFLCGDVMTGRGIDQILPHPCPPAVHEPYVKDARAYVTLAEEANGPIVFPVEYDYIWGDALAELEKAVPDVRIINLETSITSSEDYWKGKGINYRMNPENIECLNVAGVDCCVLANNHVLDWGYSGLEETLETLAHANIRSVGAGRDLEEASAPIILDINGKGRVIVFAFGHASSGVPKQWTASRGRPGINILKDVTVRSVRRIQQQIADARRSGDVVVASIHWGGNWGYGIPREHRAFARRLIDDAGVDVVHGHSSHHVKGMEVYQNKLILYGCGDFLNDYEGIGGNEAFRYDLSLMYFPRIDPSTGHLVGLSLTPMQIRKFRTNRASANDAQWLCDTLNAEGRALGTRLQMSGDDGLSLSWN